MTKEFDLTTKETPVILSKHEENLLKELHKIRYGQIIIHLKDGQPVRIEEVRKSIEL